MIKILAIDDKGDNLILLKAIIEDAFPESIFYSALNGPKGIELAIANDPDVILLDILMPEMEGYEVCRRLKQDERVCDIPVIFLTAMKENRENRIKALAAGGEAFLYKPIDEAELTAQIRAMVKIKQASEQKRTEQERLARLVAERTRELEQSQIETFKLLEELQSENESRKGIEEELRESEAKYRTLFETMLQGVVYHAADGKIISANKAAERILGLTTDQIMGRTSFDPRWKSIHEDGSTFPGDTHPAIESIKTGKEIKDVVMGIFNPENDNYRWINVCAVPQFKPGESKPYQVYSTFDDITERKHTEEALKENEAKFRTLFTRMSEGFAFHEVVYDANHTAIDYRILDINTAFERQIGILAEKAIGTKATELYGVSSAPYLDIYASVAETGKPQFFETYFPPLEKHFEISVFSPNPGYFATIFTDITERKRTEKLLIESEATARAIMEATDDVLILMNKEGIVIDCNEAHAQRFGTTRKELLGKNVFNLLPPEIANHRRNNINEVISSGKPVSSEDFRGGHYNEFSIYPIFIQNEITDMVAVFARDITKRKKTEELLKENEACLREAVASKDKFFSIIAHDLKNPFNSIIGFSDLLVEQVREKNYESIGEYSAIIQNSSQRVMDLLMNLLEWSRSQTGRMEFNPEFVDMSALVKQVRELLDDTANQKSINIDMIIPRNAPVIADKAMISTVLRNLISNAVKFTGQGGAITISIMQNQKELMVSVADNGLGIKREMIDNLFRIEESQSTPGTNNERGTGLGLILCKEFIEKHGGKIWVESEPGKGSTFHFSIPKMADH